MPAQHLTRGEKGFMEIIRHFECARGENVPIQSIMALKDKYMPSGASKEIDSIMQILAKKGFITIKRNNVILNQKGGDYLYN